MIWEGGGAAARLPSPSPPVCVIATAPISIITTSLLLFCRIVKLEEMLNTMDTFSRLSSSHIEGIEVISSRFQILVTGMRKKPYDFLDQRKSEFDVDYEEFRRLAQDILVSTEHGQYIVLKDKTYHQ